MFYRLKNEYMLRGWKLLPTGVINRETRDYKFLPKNKYSVLLKCNGQSELFGDAERQIISELLADGYIEARAEVSPLEDGQNYRFYPNRFMHAVHWSITGKCNCRCRHCYMSAPRNLSELSHAQCLDIISQMEQCGIQKVSLTGGESLVRKDFWEIVDALTASDIKINTIFSNGLLINEKFILEMSRRNLRPSFQISFDGVDGCHDWLRGVEGAEKFTLRALKLLQEKNLPVMCAFAIHKGNLSALRETVKTLANFGVKFLRVAPIHANGEALGMNDKILSTEELYDFHLSYIPQYIADGAPLPLNLTGVFEGINISEYRIPFAKAPENVNCDRDCVCSQIRTGMHIDFEGFMMPCPTMGIDANGKKLFSRITDKKLADLLNDGAYMNFISTRLADYFKANPECEACEYKNRCGSGCRGLAMVKNRDGNLLGVDKFNCKFFKGGYYNRVIELGDKLNLTRIGA